MIQIYTKILITSKWISLFNVVNGAEERYEREKGRCLIEI